MADDPGIKTIGFPLIELQSVDSTNNYARGQIHADLAYHGMAITAREQTKGRGQFGRKWATEKDEGLALSIIAKPDFLPLHQQFQLSACAAMAAHQLFSKYAGDETKIKWPNDIYWRDRKAGGILIESVVGSSAQHDLSDAGGQTSCAKASDGKWKWAIAGIGLNINQPVFPDWVLNPVSLRQITGRQFDVLALVKECCEFFEACYSLLRDGGFEKIYNYYLAHLYKKDESVLLKEKGRKFYATIKSVSPQGKLIVQHSMEEEFISGQIEWLIK